MPALNPTFTPEELQSEEWRPCARFPKYEVSSLGRVRRAASQKILNQWPNGHGYPFASLHSKTIRVHQLVADAFLFGPRSPLTEVNHKNLDKLNNRADNLEYLSRGEHLKHTVANGCYDSGDLWKQRHRKHSEGMRGESHPNATISNTQAIAILKLHQEGKKPKEISLILQISHSIARHVVYGDSWKHLISPCIPRSE